MTRRKHSSKPDCEKFIIAEMSEAEEFEELLSVQEASETPILMPASQDIERHDDSPVSDQL